MSKSHPPSLVDGAIDLRSPPSASSSGALPPTPLDHPSPTSHSYSPKKKPPARTIIYEDPHPIPPPTNSPTTPHRLPHWSTTNDKRARFHTSCPACHKTIDVGAPISYQFQYRRFVHSHCATGPRTHHSYSPPLHPNAHSPDEMMKEDDLASHR